MRKAMTGAALTGPKRRRTPTCNHLLSPRRPATNLVCRSLELESPDWPLILAFSLDPRVCSAFSCLAHSSVLPNIANAQAQGSSGSSPTGDAKTGSTEQMCLVVERVPPGTKEADLIFLFSQYGTVQDVRLTFKYALRRGCTLSHLER